MEKEFSLSGDRRLCVFDNITEATEGMPVECWWSDGRFMLRAYNECGNRHIQLPISDIVDGLTVGPKNGALFYAHRSE